MLYSSSCEVRRPWRWPWNTHTPYDGDHRQYIAHMCEDVYVKAKRSGAPSAVSEITSMALSVD